MPSSQTNTFFFLAVFILSLRLDSFHLEHLELPEHSLPLTYDSAVVCVFARNASKMIFYY
jgi:hypothetical protein